MNANTKSVFRKPFSGTKNPLFRVFMFSLLLMAVKANAQVIANYSGSGGSSTTVSYATNTTGTTLLWSGFGSNTPCSSGGKSGITVSTSWSSYNTAGPRIYYKVTPNAGYVLNVTGFTSGLRRSGTGPSQVRFAYSLDNGATWVDDLLGKSPNNGSCGANAAHSWYVPGGGALPTGITSTNGIIVAMFPYASSNSSGTFQLNNMILNGTVTAVVTDCTGTPTAGTASAATSSFCGSGSTLLTLSGASSGTGIAYQWASSPTSGGTYTNITGATNLTYTTPTISTSTFYKATTTCTTSALSATTAPVAVTITPYPSAGAITGVPAYLYIGTPVTLSNAVSGGIWSSTNTGVATIGSATGTVTGLIPGTSIISYTVVSGVCTTAVTAPLNVLHPGTIAAYLGSAGTSVGTIAFTGVTTTTLTATGFGAASPCSTGGISGLTNNGVTTYATSNAHVYFKVNADAGTYYDVTGFHVTLRKSASGIQKVRLAYSLDNGATWSDDGVDQAPDNTSCGQSVTDYAYATTLPAGVLATSPGVLFALYPYAPGATGGVIQVNAIDVVGNTHVCEYAEEITGEIYGCPGTTTVLSGYSAGGTWSSSDGSVATIGSAGDVTGVAPGVSDITYSLTNVCGSSYYTVPFTVNPIPEIDGICCDDHVCVGSTVTLGNSTTPGIWSSTDPSVATIDAVLGDVVGIASGTVIISYAYTSIETGCTGYTSMEFTVNPVPDAPFIGCYNDLDICIDEEISLCAFPEGGTWSSSDPSIATVGMSDGLITGISLGSSTVTYTVTNEYGCSAYSVVTINVVECGRGVTGVNELTNAADIKVYPNPASSVFHIAAGQKVNVSVLSIDGKVLFDVKDASEIKVSNLSNGVYLLKVYDMNNVMLKTLRVTKN